jgi:hypothetical protein
VSEKLIPESQLKQAVREVLAEMLGIPSTLPANPTRQWYGTAPAYHLLGLDDPEQLRDGVRSGLFRLGHEVCDRRRARSTSCSGVRFAKVISEFMPIALRVTTVSA